MNTYILNINLYIECESQLYGTTPRILDIQGIQQYPCEKYVTETSVFLDSLWHVETA